MSRKLQQTHVVLTFRSALRFAVRSITGFDVSVSAPELSNSFAQQDWADR